MNTAQFPGITYVVPCGAAKLDWAAPARDLYTGTMFRHTWHNAVQCAAGDEAAGLGPARVLILSARYGLIDPDEVIEPYDLRMGDAGSVSAETLTEQARALGIDWGSAVYALLPRPYLARLDAALRVLDVYVQDVYEATRGIGEQRRVNVHVGRAPAEPAPAEPETGPRVWLGGDVHALWWGLPVLVSYGRLRHAKTLPAATAPWVCDSGGFSELIRHGRWTIAADRYAADLTRYATEVGRLAWAAPQDWPCTTAALDATGLTEADHQARTVASVLELRALTAVPVACVVTGLTAASYLRHVDMYRSAGVDLRTDPVVVGVGALVGRPAHVVAEIVGTLHAAGLRRLHGFGVKGPALSLVGAVLESIDSAGWSDEARRAGDLCRHGLTRWERNCPAAAQEWGTAQRRRASTGHVQPMLFADAS